VNQIFDFILSPELVRRSIREDTYETRINNWLLPWSGEPSIDAGILSIPFGRAHQSGSSGVALAPNAIRSAFLTNTTYSPDFDVDIKKLVVRDLGDVRMHMTDVSTCHENIKCAVAEIYKKINVSSIILVGGDHSITAPAIEGYKLSHPDQRLGVIHFDAHNDVRNFEDGGPTNGTPIRGIIEKSAGVKGSNICQVGIHGFMNSSFYKLYCEEQGITVLTSRQVRKIGIEAAVEKAISIATNSTDAVWLTVDIDVLTLPYCFGTGAMSPEGLEPWDLLEAMFKLGNHPKVKAIDLVCIDPLRDYRDYTARVGCSIILTYLGGLLLRITGNRGY
jgi:formiminoglutamase